MKRALISWCLLICTCATLTGMPNLASADSKAERFTTKLADEVLSTLNSDKSDEKKLSALESLFKRHVDTDWIGRFVLGKHWRSLKSDEKKRYLKSYKNFLIKSYTSRFTAFSGQTYKLGRSHQDESGDSVVELRIIDPHGGPDVITEYRLRPHGKSYKVVDIAVEGVSLLTTQRSEFGSFVGRNGVDSLIKALDKKAERL